MQIHFCIKQLGKKTPILETKTISFGGENSEIGLAELIKIVVEDMATTYNNKTIESPDFDNFSNSTFALPLINGKIGFNKTYNENKVDIKYAQENAIQAFEDGIFLVFYGDDEITELKSSIDLSENKVFSFVRLVFLSGGYF